MESQNNLETNGNLQINPFAELLVEISQNQLSGSLRIINEAQKNVVYFDAGEPIFAVSNARQHRLFEMLLQAEKITKEQLTAIPDFTNDLALKENLLKNELFEKTEIEAFFSAQILEILKYILSRQMGDWTFSPLVRIKGDIRFQINWRNLLAKYARNLPTETILGKLKDSSQSFKVNSPIPANVNLSPPESFVFSRFENSAMTIEEIQTLSGLPEAEAFRNLYALWLGGFVSRQSWNTAFSERKISSMQSARLAVKKEETQAPAVQPLQKKVEAPPVEPKAPTEEIETDEKQMPLEEYLERVEKATNYYEVLALSQKASISEVKLTYFALAKRFHPDLFHKESDAALLQRVQHAFTEIAQAYETLKTENSRDLYDFKMRKELAEMKAVEETETTHEEINQQKQIEQAAENFEQGFSLLMSEKHEAAIPFLARAVHFDGGNARYHAYYGKALSADNKQRHKAEDELQRAVKFDNENADYRIMLAEFYALVGLRKRAEGELNRLLAIFPSNRERRHYSTACSKNS